MKKYKSYSKIDLPWISSIPSHWVIAKNRQFLREINIKTETGTEDLLMVSQYTGITKKSRNPSTGMRMAVSQVGYKIVKSNDIVINIMLAWNGSIGTSRYSGIVSPAYSVFRCSENINPWYIHYLFRTPLLTSYFKAYSTGIIESRLRLYPNVLSRLYSILPPRSEQDQIVRYLDWQVSKINKLIIAKKKKIALLRERAQIIVQDKIFHGLNNCTDEINSGIPWIGCIPVKWNVTRIKNLFTMRDERNHQPLADVNLLSLYTSNGVVQNCDVEYKSGNKARNADNYKIVRNGDIVVNIILCWMGAVGRSNYDGVTSPAYDIYVPKSNVSSRYYHYLFRLPIFSGECKKKGHGIMAMRWRTYSPEFRSIYVPEPPYDEQEQIADWLDKYMSNMDRFILSIKKEIDVLYELRTRLISDVVTGQIDVRGIEIPEYEYVEEEPDEESDEIESMEEETEEQEE